VKRGLDCGRGSRRIGEARLGADFMAESPKQPDQFRPSVRRVTRNCGDSGSTEEDERHDEWDDTPARTAHASRTAATPDPASSAAGVPPSGIQTMVSVTANGR